MPLIDMELSVRPSTHSMPWSAQLRNIGSGEAHRRPSDRRRSTRRPDSCTSGMWRPSLHRPHRFEPTEPGARREESRQDQRPPEAERASRLVVPMQPEKGLDAALGVLRGGHVGGDVLSARYRRVVGMLSALVEHDVEVTAVGLGRARERPAIGRLHFSIVGANEEDEWRVGPVLPAVIVADLSARRVNGDGGAETLDAIAPTRRTDGHRRERSGAAIRPTLHIYTALHDIGARAQVFQAGVGVQRTNGDFVDFGWTLLDRAGGKAGRMAARTERVDEQDEIAARRPKVAPH